MPDDCTDKEYHVKVVHELKNLLATIHRDGGHHFVEHGLLKSIKDAKVKVIHERESLNDAILRSQCR